jgi:hypothetical protein
VLLGRAPLARGSDRLQALSRLLLVLAFLAAVPLSLLVGVLVHDRVAADAAAQRTARSEVSATLVADAGRATAAPGSYGTSATDGTAATRAVWRTPQGVHQGLVDAPAGSRAGSVVRIWVDGRGEPTVAPIGDGDVAAEAVSAAVLTASVLVGLAALGHLGLVTLLDRSRMRRWAREWAATEPLWTSRSR